MDYIYNLWGRKESDMTEQLSLSLLENLLSDLLLWEVSHNLTGHKKYYFYLSPGKQVPIRLVRTNKMTFFLNFIFIFKLYIIVLVLPNIKMNPPQVYMCSPS